MLFSIVSLNNWVSWLTRLWLLRSDDVLIFLMFTSQKRIISLSAVDLPEPLGPFIAMILFFGISILKFSRICSLSYAKPTFLHSIPSNSTSLPLMFSSTTGLSSRIDSTLLPLARVWVKLPARFESAATGPNELIIATVETISPSNPIVPFW